MDFVTIQYRINLNELTNKNVERICRYYSGTLNDIVLNDDEAILIIVAPSSWRTIILNELLLPYRYI